MIMVYWLTDKTEIKTAVYKKAKLRKQSTSVRISMLQLKALRKQRTIIKSKRGS